MPKRSYPFEESFQSQQKIHIGTRQINEGIMKSEKMEQIYDKTLKMLYSGSKQNGQTALDSLNNNVDRGTRDIPPLERAHLQSLRQMEITSQGRLAMPDKPDVCESSNRLLPDCKVCRSNSSDRSRRTASLSSCGYCDSILCDSCVQTCSRCAKDFCSTCSFSEYEEDSERRIICLSCF